LRSGTGIIISQMEPLDLLWGNAVVVSFGASTMLRLKAFERGNDMNKGYWVVAYRKVPDLATVKEYAALLTPTLDNFGGRMLVSPTSVVTAQEAGLEQMTVLVEFDSYEFALAAYESDDHKKAFAVLGPGVERDFRIVKGV
jgi:uncharacterized protein (DUF1330 family)